MPIKRKEGDEIVVDIKFRAWDKEKKIMLPVKLLDYAEWWVSCDPHYGINTNPLDYGERNSFRNEETDRHILMQFAGFTTNDNQEVYENDIVKDGYGKIFVVRKVGGTGSQPNGFGGFTQFQCCIPCKDGKWEIAPKVSFHGMKKLGNIYENSDLLGL